MRPVSVIISVFNRLDYLEKALLSVSYQSLIPDEVVICDDGSEEPIVDFVKNRASEFPFKLKLVRQSDKGFRLARCKNNGIRAARNDFLVFWDQDVVGTHDYLQTYFENRRPGFFIVSYPVRLTPYQTGQITAEDIKKGTFDHLITKAQIEKIHRQFRKDRFYFYLRKLVLPKDTRPKLRGGVFAAFKDDLLKVNGFDENYRGWGNEDDDLGRRLYAAGVVGFNPFYDQFPLHLYHAPHHVNGKRTNQEYYGKRKKEIASGHYRAEFGIDRSRDDDPVEILEF